RPKESRPADSMLNPHPKSGWLTTIRRLMSERRLKMPLNGGEVVNAAIYGIEARPRRRFEGPPAGAPRGERARRLLIRALGVLRTGPGAGICLGWHGQHHDHLRLQYHHQLGDRLSGE